MVSFTGSAPVGYAIMDRVPRKHVTLELGGNAAAVVLADADLDWAASRIALFSNYQAGQSCIAVQRVIVEDAVYDDFVDRLRAAPSRPSSPATRPTRRPRSGRWSRSRPPSGWSSGSARPSPPAPACWPAAPATAPTVAPTVLADVPRRRQGLPRGGLRPGAWCCSRVAAVDEAFAAVNDSTYGLQAGVFTRSLDTAFRANRELEVGGVIIGDVPSYRADQMPYGGVKDSGVGREGLRSAMEDFTYEKVMVLTGLTL